MEFSQFCQNKVLLFNALKDLFDVPNVNAQDSCLDIFVYLAVSLGESDILITVLLPMSLRPHVRTQLNDRKIIRELKQHSITGVYFSRRKKKQLITRHNELFSDSSESLFSNLSIEDSTFETTATNHAIQTKQSTGELTLNSPLRRHCRTNHSCANEVLPTSRRDSKFRSMYGETDQNCNYAQTQKNAGSTNDQPFVDYEQAVVKELLTQHHVWKKKTDSKFSFTAKYQSNSHVSVCINEEAINAQTNLQSKEIKSKNELNSDGDKQQKGRGVLSQDNKAQFRIIEGEPLETSLTTPKMTKVFGIAARLDPRTQAHENFEDKKDRHSHLNTQQILPKRFENNNKTATNLREREDGGKRNINLVVKKGDLKTNNVAATIKLEELSSQKSEPEIPQRRVEKKQYLKCETPDIVSQNNWLCVEEDLDNEYRQKCTSFTDQEDNEVCYNRPSFGMAVNNVRQLLHTSGKTEESYSPGISMIVLPNDSTDEVNIREPLEKNYRQLKTKPSPVEIPYYEPGSNIISSPTLYTPYKDKRVGYLEGYPIHSIIFMKSDSDLASEPQMESEVTVFTDDSGRDELAPPPYHPPPDYQLAKEILKRKSHKSFDDLSLCYGK